MNDEFLLIPSIDLKGGKCVRLYQGDAKQVLEYGDDPVAIALRWQEQGARLLHLVDLDGAFQGQIVHLESARAIFRAVEIPVQFGGGVRTADDVRRLLDLGAGRVVLGTVAVERPDVVEEALRYRADAVVVGMDARNGMVALRGWVDQTKIAAVDLAKKMGNLGVPRIIYTDVDRDGTLRGNNVSETQRIAWESGVKVIASGGVGGMEDIHRLWEVRGFGIEGVILGRALYDGKLDYPSAQKLLSELRNS